MSRRGEVLPSFLPASGVPQPHNFDHVLLSLKTGGVKLQLYHGSGPRCSLMSSPALDSFGLIDRENARATHHSQ